MRYNIAVSFSNVDDWRINGWVYPRSIIMCCKARVCRNITSGSPFFLRIPRRESFNGKEREEYITYISNLSASFSVRTVMHHQVYQVTQRIIIQQIRASYSSGNIPMMNQLLMCAPLIRTYIIPWMVFFLWVKSNTRRLKGIKFPTTSSDQGAEEE